MKKKQTVLLVIVLAIMSSVTGCAHNEKLVEILPVNQIPVPKTWVVSAINLEQRVPDRELEKRIPEILSFLGDKYKITVHQSRETVQSGTTYVNCSIWIKEQVFSISLDQYTSVAAIITLTDPATNQILARALLSQESEMSLKSFNYLFSILDELVRALSLRVK
ncbi:MAG: hypothetical protein EHM28_08185 [Spirochaetaceae bacterium]|nr:MAG: hypothetical protein EHM28_08185 [Spirochaetaceae bacterium]